MQDTSSPATASARKAKDVTLQQISALTKISVRWLQAIEDGEFKKFPGGVYDISYIRQYADAIECDATELLAFYQAKMNPLPIAPVAKKTGSSFFRSLRPGIA